MNCLTENEGVSYGGYSGGSEFQAKGPGKLLNPGVLVECSRKSEERHYGWGEERCIGSNLRSILQGVLSHCENFAFIQSEIIEGFEQRSHLT